MKSERAKVGVKPQTNYLTSLTVSQELMVIDSMGYNLALNKPVTGTAQYVGDPSTYSLSAGNDGIIE